MSFGVPRRSIMRSRKIIRRQSFTNTSIVYQVLFAEDELSVRLSLQNSIP